MGAAAAEGGASATPTKPSTSPASGSSSSGKTRAPIESPIIVATPQPQSQFPSPTAAAAAPHPDSVLDDVSASVDFGHPCSSPAFLDAPRLAAGMQLGPHACALVLITKVVLEVSADSKVFVSVNYHSDSYSYWGLLPLRANSPFRWSLDAPPSLVGGDADGCFARFGTFQIPVFCGRCPPEILRSARPWDTLTELVTRQQEREVARWAAMDRARPFFSFGGRVGQAQVAPEAPAEEETGAGAGAGPGPGGPSHVSLSSGASILIKVSDARMAAFAPTHIARDPSLTPDAALLDPLLRLYSFVTATPASASNRARVLRHLQSTFHYDVYRDQTHPEISWRGRHHRLHLGPLPEGSQQLRVAGALPHGEGLAARHGCHD